MLVGIDFIDVLEKEIFRHMGSMVQLPLDPYARDVIFFYRFHDHGSPYHQTRIQFVIVRFDERKAT
jgi:hypothetical protein